MPALSERIALLQTHPLHRAMGVTQIEAEAGRASLQIVVGDAAVNPRGALHGGVIYTLCDLACYAALSSELGEGEDAATTDLHVSVMRAARAGESIRVLASVLKRGRNVAFLQSDVQDAQGQLLARASVTKSILKKREPSHA